MKKFDPLSYTKKKWSDPNHTKNHPLSCNQMHSFCHIDYEWEEDQVGNKLVSSPINPSLPNINLDDPKQPTYPISYQSMTEENIDDWIAQSMNRNLGALTNPQKKFFIPSPLDDDLRQRYRGNKAKDKTNENETYFQSSKAKIKQKGYLSHDKKIRNDISDLYFNYSKLCPNQQLIGTPIKLRQNRQHNRTQIRHRNAVILQNDIHYQRFLRELNKQNQPQQVKVQSKQIVANNHHQKQMIYCFNVQNLKRKSCYEETPNSIIEKQFQRIRKPTKDFLTSNRAHIRNQELIQDKFRAKINNKTTNALKMISTMIEGQTQKKVTEKRVQRPAQVLQLSANNSKIAGKKVSLRTNTLQTGQFKKDRRLQSKVMKLLNNMQVQPETIDEKMQRLNIHVDGIFLKHLDFRPQVKWIIKAQQKVKQHKNDQAIDCYKQAIILQPEFFIPVFNIAVLLEKQKLLNSSLMWFYLARDFQIDQQIVTFGIALVLLKQLQFQQSLHQINQLIVSLENTKKNVHSVYYYLRTLCFKQLGKFQQAKADYGKIAHVFKPSNYNYLSNFIFSIVFGKSRRLSIKFNCLSYMNWKETLFMVFLESVKRIKQQHQTLTQIVQKVIKLPFFNRFSISLIRKLLLISRYQVVKKDNLFFINKDESALLISGLMSIRNHENNYSRPNTISVLQQGGIIGGGDIDNNISARPNNWYLASTDVELLCLNRDDFKLFWNGQITYQFDFKYNFLKNVKLFHNLSQATIFKLCEIMVLNTYDKNTILFNDGAYRQQIINKAGQGFGLSKKLELSDPRFVNVTKPTKNTQKRPRGGGMCRILQILRKHIFRFNDMKFNRLRYSGLFVLVKGNIEVQNDRGFRCQNLLGEMDFFGENLIIDTDGLHNYGRMVVVNGTAQLYTLSLNKMIWAFTSQDVPITLKIEINNEYKLQESQDNRYSQFLTQSVPIMPIDKTWAQIYEQLIFLIYNYCYRYILSQFAMFIE